MKKRASAHQWRAPDPLEGRLRRERGMVEPGKPQRQLPDRRGATERLALRRAGGDRPVQRSLPEHLSRRGQVFRALPGGRVVEALSLCQRAHGASLGPGRLYRAAGPGQAAIPAGQRRNPGRAQRRIPLSHNRRRLDLDPAGDGLRPGQRAERGRRLVLYLRYLHAEAAGAWARCPVELLRRHGAAGRPDGPADGPGLL